MNRHIQNLRLFSVILVGLLLLLELLLRAYGVEFRMSLSDMGRKSKVKSHFNTFVAAAQNASVSENAFNIYFLGESTMWGVPYGPAISIPGLVDYRLGGTLAGQPVRSINLAVAAKDAAYVRYLLERALREKEVFHPSLIVIYSGNNEFIKFHPTEPDFHAPGIRWLVRHFELARQLLTPIARNSGEILEIDNRNFSDRAVFPFDPNGHSKVVEHYRKYYLQMVKLTEKAKVPLVISTLVSNYASWEPNRSVFCVSNQAKAKKERFLQVFQRGLKAETQNDYNAALKFYDGALSICDGFAEAHFRQGKVYETLHQYEKAWEAFQKAIDHDGMPIRALSSQNDFIRSLDRFDHVQVVDSLAYLRSHSPNGLLDEHLIIDGVHPNLEGYLLMSEAIAAKIHSSFSSDKESLTPLDIDTARKIFGVDKGKMFEVSYQEGRWTTRLATWRYDATKRLGTAEAFFRQAAEIDPKRHEGFLGLGVVSLIKGDTQTAENYLQKARDLDVESVGKYLQIPWIRKIARRANAKTSIPFKTFHGAL